MDNNDGTSANQRQILNDVLGNVLPRLQVGLDVNVKFGSVRKFEYTQELDAFYMLGIDLVHGWVVDNANKELHKLISDLSYNQLTDVLVKISSKLDLLREKEKAWNEISSVVEHKTKENHCTEEKHARRKILPESIKPVNHVETQENLSTDDSNEMKVISIHTVKVAPGSSAPDQYSNKRVPKSPPQNIATAVRTRVPTGSDAPDLCNASPILVEATPLIKSNHQPNLEPMTAMSVANVAREVPVLPTGTKLVHSSPLEVKPVLCVPVVIPSAVDIPSNGVVAPAQKLAAMAAGNDAAEYTKNIDKKEVVGVETKDDKKDDKKDDNLSLESRAEIQSEIRLLTSKRNVLMEFLETSATQMTYFGLSQLHTSLTDGTTCVFFRNNHFSVMRKRKKELYLLVTDISFVNMNSIVWEKLTTVTGDSLFVDGDFKVSTTPESTQGVPPAGSFEAKNRNIPHFDRKLTDEELARELVRQDSLEQSQRDKKMAEELQRQIGGGVQVVQGVPATRPQLVKAQSDEEFARQLQEEENQRVRRQQQQQLQGQQGQQGDQNEHRNAARHQPTPLASQNYMIAQQITVQPPTRQLSDEEFARQLHRQELAAAKPLPHDGRRPPAQQSQQYIRRRPAEEKKSRKQGGCSLQ